MNNRFYFAFVLAGFALIVAMLFFRNHPGPNPAEKSGGETAKTQPASPSPGVKLPSAVEAPSGVKTSVALVPGTDSFQDRILDLWQRHASPAEVAALLKELQCEDPRHLFQALLALSKTPLETRKTLVPLLANALTLWPDAEGRDVFPVANAYGEMDLPSAAQWASTFLSTTGRSDLNVADLLGEFAGPSESQALAMIATLPDAARAAALQDAAYHIPTSDLNHLMAVCQQMDPNGTTAFSQLLFQRLAMERLNDTAAWLATTPQAQNLPGAAAAIAQGLVLAGNPQTALTWVDSLSSQTAQGQAIAEVYQQFTIGKPDSAIQDILNAYPATSQLIPNGETANLSESGLTGYWDAASNLQNSSARAYAIAALIEPTLLASGLAQTKADIAALPDNSMEQNVAQIVLQSDLHKPQVAIALQNPAKP